jgi:hypothetical protein
MDPVECATGYRIWKGCAGGQAGVRKVTPRRSGGLGDLSAPKKPQDRCVLPPTLLEGFATQFFENYRISFQSKRFHSRACVGTPFSCNYMSKG